jgi:hypothetical protein
MVDAISFGLKTGLPVPISLTGLLGFGAGFGAGLGDTNGLGTGIGAGLGAGCDLIGGFFTGFETLS